MSVLSHGTDLWMVLQFVQRPVTRVMWVLGRASGRVLVPRYRPM